MRSVWNELRRIIRSSWRVALIGFLVGMVLGASYFILSPPSYTSTTSLYVNSQGSNSIDGAYQGSLLSQERVKSYTDLVTSTRVTSEIGRRLNLPESPEEIARHISATNPVDSVIINVAVSSDSPVQSARIANTAADVFTDLVAELEAPLAPNSAPAVSLKRIEPAYVPTNPSSMGLVSALGLGGVGGLALAALFIVVVRRLDTTIKTTRELAAHSGRPVLASIPRESALENAAGPASGLGGDQSAAAEAFRQLRTALKFVGVDRVTQVVSITSALPGEGKSTVALGLAAALRTSSAEVLLVEADLRRPALTGRLGISSGVGLTNVLARELPFSAVVQRSASTRIDVVPSGPIPPNPSELLGSHQMSVFLSEARAQYDYIVLDTPPVLPVTDAVVVSLAADTTLVVVRQFETTEQQIKQAMALFERAGDTSGTILNAVRRGTSDEYASYGGQYVAAHEHEPQGLRTDNSASNSHMAQEGGATLGWVSPPPDAARRPVPYKRRETPR